MYEEGDLIKDMKFEGSLTFSQKEVPLLDAPFVEISSNTRLYYLPREEGTGYLAYVVTFGGCPGDESSFEGNTEILDFIEVMALFDGIRHMHFNSKARGYIYYPSDLIKTFEELNKLTEKFCSHPINLL